MPADSRAGSDIFKPDASGLRTVGSTGVTIGAADPTLLDDVAGAVFFNGGIAIANKGYHQVLLLDSAGGLVYRQGREGFGPGEYQNLDGIFRNDSGLVAWDLGRGRLTHLGPDGLYRKETTVRFPTLLPGDFWIPRMLGVAGPHALFEVEQMGFPGPGSAGPVLERPKAGYFLLDLSSGEVVFDTTVPGQERWSLRVAELRMEGGIDVIFGRRSAGVTWGERSWIGDTDSVFLARISGTRSPDLISVPAISRSARPLWESMVRDSLARVHGRSTGPPGEFDRELLVELPAHSTLPMFDQIVQGSDGLLWIRQYPAPDEDLVIWVALDESLQPLQWVSLPARFKVMDWARDRVLVLEIDELGINLVKLLTLSAAS